MAAPYLVAPNADLDYLLGEVARALQLTPTQYELAVDHYTAVADWLAAPDSPLARFKPRIYPQGSMAIETTVRPRTRDEHDLDLVCQLLPTGMTAIQVFLMVHGRIRAHKTYAQMLELKNRCSRLNYAHDFHLDIISAEPDVTRGGTAVLVPDRELRAWTPSNPKGYIDWFTRRSQITVAELRKNVDLVPGPTPSDEKPALAVAVQLIKRRRDTLCDDDLAPRSIVLTTLAGEYYRGTDCVLTAMVQIVAGIQQRIAAAHPGRISVCNPTNPTERFCESFNESGRYEAFRWFIAQLERDLARIASAQGIPQLQKVLAETFGEEPVTKAIGLYAARHKSQRDSRALEFSGAGAGGLSIVTPVSGITRVAPPHQYFGGQGGD